MMVTLAARTHRAAAPAASGSGSAPAAVQAAPAIARAQDGVPQLRPHAVQTFSESCSCAGSGYSAASPAMSRDSAVQFCGGGASCDCAHEGKAGPVPGLGRLEEFPPTAPPVVQRHDAGNGSAQQSESPDPGRVLGELGAGGPLPAQAAELFGAAYGSSLGHVQVHADSSVPARYGARALTVGHHVAFAPGRFQPDTEAGQELIGHELAHVAQQQGGTPGVQAAAGPASDAHEHEADAAARAALSADPVRGLSSVKALQRQPLSEEERARRIAELESEAARPNLSPEELARLNEERNRISGEESPRAAPSGATVTEPERSLVGDTGGQLTIPVGLTYEIVGELPESGTGGEGAIPPLTLAGETTGDPSLSAPIRPQQDLEGLETAIAAGVNIGGRSLLSLIDPLPGPVSGGLNTYTRFAGQGVESLNPQLYPRLWQPGDVSSLAPYQRAGISYAQLNELSRALRGPRGLQGLSPEQLVTLRTVTRLHAVEGAVGSSPVVSLTGLSPDEALTRLPPVAQYRTYVVRVRIHPDDVIRVNEMLGRAGRTTQLVDEIEILVGRDLGGQMRPGPLHIPGRAEIVSITANPHEKATFGGRVAPALRWVGRGLVVVSAVTTMHEIVTAEGPHRRQTQGRAFGSFAGSTLLGAFGAGFCVGAGIATGGIALALCVGGFGIAGAVGGGFAGSAVGGLFD